MRFPEWFRDWLSGLFDGWISEKTEKELPLADDESGVLPDAHLSRSVYSLSDYRCMPVHDVTMEIRGNKLITTGEALKISEAFGMGCEVTWWFKWDGRTYARVIEGYRSVDCADGIGTKDIPDGWMPFKGCGHYHGGDEALTWWDVAADVRGENIGYTASKVVSRRNDAESWRSGLVRVVS